MFKAAFLSYFLVLCLDSRGQHETFDISPWVSHPMILDLLHFNELEYWNT